MNLFTITTLFLIAGQAYAQDAVTFKVKYGPGHSYDATYNSEMKIEMQVIASPEEMGKISFPAGFKNPVIINNQVISGAILTAGQLNRSREMPITITYPNSFSVATMEQRREKSMSMLFNKTIYARVQENGKVKLDSVSGGTPNDKLQALVDEKLKELQGEIQFAPKALRVGGSFTKKGNMMVPIEAAGNLPAEMVTVYTLTEIKDDLAYFDFHKTIKFSNYTQNVEINLTGFGDGKAVYDIKNNFIKNTVGIVNCSFTLHHGPRMVKGTTSFEERQAMTID